ncbi:hypothetical protein KZ820_13365 [Sphingomonas sp. RRHST34]|uniref:Uncharacterized protein n=1 Tax=Sphingomonas citri TaxID=2862499 RepID=A0ABS7BQ34_9SPHN|nr:hypothetical protein [Sphingomonas citri]MBW6531727.1 hypothetical protein [Sphingomonas citri]
MLTALVLLLGSPATGAPAVSPRAAAAHDERAHATAVLTAAFARLLPPTAVPPRVTLSDVAVAAPFARREADAVIVDPRVAELIHTSPEALAFAALALGYDDDDAARTPSSAGIDLRTVAAALAVGAAGDRLDRSGRAETPDDRRARRRYDWTPPTTERLSASAAAARRAVALLTRAGGCTAPLVALLRRMAATERDPGGRPAALFARQVLDDLGPVAYPPDGSCLRP